MKLVKLLLVGVLFATTYAMQAQGGRLTPEERALVVTYRMSKYLQLTETQKTDIMKIHQNAFDKLELAHQKFRDDKEMLRKSRKEIFETRDAELQKVLTKEQFETFQQKQMELKEEHKKEMKAHRAMHQEHGDKNPSKDKPAGDSVDPKVSPGKQ